MISSGRCHGPGCTQTADGDFCGEKCAWAWHQQHADHARPAATIQLEWRHPYHGRIVEHVCEKHEQEVLRALKALGIGCAGSYFDASACLRCDNDGVRPREWLPSCAEPEDLPVELAADPARGWLTRWFDRLFGRTT